MIWLLSTPSAQTLIPSVGNIQKPTSHSETQLMVSNQWPHYPADHYRLLLPFTCTHAPVTALPPCLPPSFPSQAQAITNLLSTSKSSAFPVFTHKVECGVLSFWLVSLNMRSSRLCRVAGMLGLYCIFMAVIPLYVFFLHSSTNGASTLAVHPGCYEQCYNKHGSIGIALHLGFLSFGFTHHSGSAGMWQLQL